MNQHVSVGDTLVARPLFKEANINRDVAFDAAPQPARRRGKVKFACWRCGLSFLSSRSLLSSH